MSQFLKLFPGDKDFKQVSEREWDAPYDPFKDQNGHGNILGLTADVRVWDRPGGKLLVARKWPSRSFIRNFARLMRMMFSGSQLDVFNTAAAPYLTKMAGDSFFGSHAFHPNRSLMLGAGAGMAIGDGASAEDHTRSDLVSRIGGVDLANGAVSTTVDSAATLTLQITKGITVAQSGGITAREIALFMFIAFKDSPPDTVEGGPVLMAYDGIADTPVAQGGVIAPRYTLNFPV